MEKEFIGERITQLRVLRGYSARDMSLSLGQNPGYINAVESGKAMPSMNVFLYICDYLKVTPKEFFDVETEKPTKADIICAKIRMMNEEQLNFIGSVLDHCK